MRSKVCQNRHPTAGWVSGGKVCNSCTGPTWKRSNKRRPTPVAVYISSGNAAEVPALQHAIPSCVSGHISTPKTLLSSKRLNGILLLMTVQRRVCTVSVHPVLPWGTQHRRLGFWCDEKGKTQMPAQILASTWRTWVIGLMMIYTSRMPGFWLNSADLWGWICNNSNRHQANLQIPYTSSSNHEERKAFL